MQCRKPSLSGKLSASFSKSPTKVKVAFELNSFTSSGFSHSYALANANALRTEVSSITAGRSARICLVIHSLRRDIS